jgi:hypothetical protein
VKLFHRTICIDILSGCSLASILCLQICPTESSHIRITVNIWHCNTATNSQKLGENINIYHEQSDQINDKIAPPWIILFPLKMIASVYRDGRDQQYIKSTS